MKLTCGKYLGRETFFENSSYNCPALGLYGFSTERALRSAMRRKLKKMGLDINALNS